MRTREEYHLRVFSGRSVLIVPDGRVEEFAEGKPSADAKARYAKIREALEQGFLVDEIRGCKSAPGASSGDLLDAHYKQCLKSIVSSVTSEVGRALVGLTVLQLVVKAIEPSQSIRLHKGGSGEFSWKEGISMRSLDAGYISPTLRDEGLLKLNKFGFMMTRSLAENYPYSKVYKAALKGAKDEWAEITDALEEGRLSPVESLRFMLGLLINNAEYFNTLADEALEKTESSIESGGLSDVASVLDLMLRHIEIADYKARIFELLLHSYYQALEDLGVLHEGSLKPLSQMRSANKKHGNIGDVEVFDGKVIVEAWDAKYGKPYLRDELEELSDKIINHPLVQKVGFVCSGNPIRDDEIKTRVADIASVTGVSIQLVSVWEWLEANLAQLIGCDVKPSDLGRAWVRAYVQSLSQQRREKAPIDEPCQQWLEAWLKVIS